MLVLELVGFMLLDNERILWIWVNDKKKDRDSGLMTKLAVSKQEVLSSHRVSELLLKLIILST